MAASMQQDDEMPEMTMVCGYTSTAAGQVHWRTAGRPGRDRDLVLLPPAPFTSVFYATIMPLLAAERRVLAPDYPGYGGSYAYEGEASITQFADAVTAVVSEQLPNGADLLGFHSGCLVAVEMSLQQQTGLGQLVLVDVPAFTAAQREQFAAQLSRPEPLSEDIGSVSLLWQQAVTQRHESNGIETSVALFADSLRHGNRWTATFDAAFGYDVEARLPKVHRPTTVIASKSGLLESSRRAAMLIEHAALVERLDIERSVMHEAAATFAPTIAAVLDR